MVNRPGREEDYSLHDTVPVYVTVRSGQVALDTHSALERRWRLPHSSPALQGPCPLAKTCPPEESCDPLTESRTVAMTNTETCLT